MSLANTGAVGPSNEQLADILRFIARTCLEIERGLRPPEHLLKLMEPTTGLRWLKHDKIGRFPGGPVQADQIGNPHLTRLGDGKVAATVVTRTQGNRWGAITVQLQASDQGRWHVSDIQRILAASHYRTGPSQIVQSESQVTRRLHVATDDRRMANAAHQAAKRRLADLAPGAAGYQATSDLVRSWARKITELDRELADLKSRHDARQQIERALRR